MKLLAKELLGATEGMGFATDSEWLFVYAEHFEIFDVS